MIEQAATDLYRPNSGFTERDFDLAVISKALGGTKLLYALQNAFGLPSDTMLKEHHPLLKLVASVGRPCRGKC